MQSNWNIGTKTSINKIKAVVSRLVLKTGNDMQKIDTRARAKQLEYRYQNFNK
jgi:hypothetical protein